MPRPRDPQYIPIAKLEPHHCSSIYQVDENGHYVVWFGGGADDADSMRIRFFWNEHFKDWCSEITYGRSIHVHSLERLRSILQ